jgi:hypothetical protein
MGTLPARASWIAVRSNASMSPSTRAAASWVLRFFEPGLRPELPLANGRPRVAEVRSVSGPLDRRMALIHQLEFAQMNGA